MSKLCKAKPHFTREEVLNKIKNTVGFWRVQKWLIVYNALNYPRSAKEIANHLAVSQSIVHKTISEYNRYGASAIETKGKGGRRNSYMSAEEEKAFFSNFIDKAQKGSLSTVAEIKEQYEKIIGHTVHKTTIYRLLSRNGWRKIVPMPQHPKTDKEAQDSFKKTLNQM